jgi:PAS domain S-box-containing protein
MRMTRSGADNPTTQTTGWSDALLQDVFNAAPDAMIAADMSGAIVLANAQVLEIFGYEAHELIGHPVETLTPARFHDLHRAQRANYALDPLRRSMGSGLQLHGRRRDGSEFPVEVSLSPINTQQGHVILAAIRDVTDRVSMEARVDALDRSVRMKNDILAILSHELFSPITTIQGTAATLLNADPKRLDRETLREMVQGVEAATLRLRRLMRYVDAAAVIDLGGESISTAVPIGQVITATLADPQLHPERERVHVSATPEQLAQVVVVDERLAVLAILVIVENGLTLAPEDVVEIEVEQRGREMCVLISDRGPGIQDDERAQALDLFSQLDASDTRMHEGVGIGLYLARRIIEAHGGRMAIRSRNPRGSIFVLPFPSAAVDPEPGRL